MVEEALTARGVAIEERFVTKLGLLRSEAERFETKRVGGIGKQ
jgi:hypothetical protein